jgi:CTP:molybdopterin cytidylyltransferase MocA
MAIRRFGVNLGRGNPVAETADLHATEIATAAAVTGVDGVAGAVEAIEAIGTSQGTADVRVLVNDGTTTPTKASVKAALEAVMAHIQASNTYA